MLKNIVSIALASVFVSATAFAQFSVTSKAVPAGGKVPTEQVFNGMGCTGQNVSPDLSWSGAPKDTKYFAVTAYDPDAPTGSGWWHWTVINIPSSITTIEKGASGTSKLPAGAIETRTDFGKPGYGGPCPPPGDKPHRYIFTVYALKDKIDVAQDAPAAQVGYQANMKKLGEAKLQATYGR